jgi:hypothetical protein
MKTVYENLKEMLEMAEELQAMFAAKGDSRAALYAVKVEQHKAELAKYA